MLVRKVGKRRTSFIGAILKREGFINPSECVDWIAWCIVGCYLGKIIAFLILRYKMSELNYTHSNENVCLSLVFHDWVKHLLYFVLFLIIYRFVSESLSKKNKWQWSVGRLKYESSDYRHFVEDNTNIAVVWLQLISECCTSRPNRATRNRVMRPALSKRKGHGRIIGCLLALEYKIDNKKVRVSGLNVI